MHADEDPRTTLPVGVDDHRLPVPRLEEVLERQHTLDSITTDTPSAGLRVLRALTTFLTLKLVRVQLVHDGVAAAAGVKRKAVQRGIAVSVAGTAGVVVVRLHGLASALRMRS